MASAANGTAPVIAATIIEIGMLLFNAYSHCEISLFIRDVLLQALATHQFPATTLRGIDALLSVRVA